MMLYLRLRKLLRALFSRDRRWIRAALKGVFPSLEHEDMLRSLSINQVVDVGANRGQFALLVRHYCPRALIVSFEPLPQAAAVFDAIFADDDSTRLIRTAVGSSGGAATLHISRKDDSSSLLPISTRQSQIFPGTEESDQLTVPVVTLAELLGQESLTRPSLLKIDVQGYELEVLRGAEPALHQLDYVYCECSSIELYSGQPAAIEVREWLEKHGFKLAATYNVSHTRSGDLVQADYLFCKIAGPRA
jgi:FkbM family methyltransferase